MRLIITAIVMALAFAPGAEAKQVAKPKPKPCKVKPAKPGKRKPAKPGKCKPVKPAKPKPPRPAPPVVTDLPDPATCDAACRRISDYLRNCRRSLDLTRESYKNSPSFVMTMCGLPSFPLPAGLYEAATADFVTLTATPEQHQLVEDHVHWLGYTPGKPFG